MWVVCTQVRAYFTLVTVIGKNRFAMPPDRHQLNLLSPKSNLPSTNLRL